MVVSEACGKHTSSVVPVFTKLTLGADVDLPLCTRGGVCLWANAREDVWERATFWYDESNMLE